MSASNMSELVDGLTRRSVLVGALSLALTARLAAATPAVDRVMVQGRPQDTGSLYKVGNIMPALDALGGIRRMRCRAPFSDTPGWQTYSGLANEGVRFCFTIPVKAPAVLVQDLAMFESEHPGSIWAIEFPNEPDLHPVEYAGHKDARLGARSGDAPALMAYCRDVAVLLDQSPTLKTIPRVAFNDWMQAEQSELVTFVNSHIYPRLTSVPGWWLGNWQSLLLQGGKMEGVITEWGRTTGGGNDNVVAPPITLEQQAELLARDLAEILEEPTVRAVSLYELLSWPTGSEQDNFGLFNSDLTPRPVVGAIRELLS